MMTEKEHLENLQEGLQNVTEQTRTLSADLNGNQRMWRPSPDSWSIAACFEHLILTGKHWYPQIRSSVDEANPEPERKVKKFRPTLFGKFFLGTSGKKVRVKIKTHNIFKPKDNVAPDAPERFLEQQPELQNLIKDSEGLNLQKVSVRFPFTRFLRLRLGEALSLMVNHQFRHIRQAEKVIQKDNFPSH